MIKSFFHAAFLLFCQVSLAQQVPLIPLPKQYSKVEGIFKIDNQTPIVSSQTLSTSVAWLFQKELLRHTGIAVSQAASSHKPAITFKITNKEKHQEGYQLEMKPKGLTIIASTEEGLFRGISSLLQIIRSTPVKNASVSLQCWTISDAPRFSWRGFMLDESRHFFGKDKVKNILDWMAFYKLNRFHWHLTDQQGWRLEIRQYPKLTLVGGIGNYSSVNAPAKYYSQEDVREIVAYAAERFITVIPEIDMPGHATAANKAYPEFSGGGSKNYPDFTFNPGKEDTYSYLNDILKEADALFPSQMIHLGGDEVHFGNENWNYDADVKALMQNKQLADLKSVEGYFIRRMADSLRKINNKVLAWDEATELGLPVNNTIIFWWRHDRPGQLKQALDRGYPTVLCPRLPMYFDFVQDSTHKYGRRWKGDFNTLKRVYEFSPESIPEAAHKTKSILGIQANLWTETVTSVQRLDYLLFPRISALAESAWTESSNKSFKEFDNRLKSHLQLFGKDGIYFFDQNIVNKYSEPSPGESKFNNNFLD